MPVNACFESSSTKSPKIIKINEPMCGYLWGPIADPILLGGASVIIFAIFQWITLSNIEIAILATVMMVLANVVNHPHFAHSYQLFYGNWLHQDFRELPQNIQFRWRVAGMWVPLGLVAVLSGSVWNWMLGNNIWLAATINLMGALVGWHYVKQGFGMAMVDAALKKTFWKSSARRALLWNAYACWLTAWVIINHGSVGAAYWGVFNIQLSIPTEILMVMGLSVFFSTCWSVLMVTRSLRAALASGKSWSQLPLNGLMAYFVSLYLWTIFSTINPAYVLVIPFFHSVQYLTVVWRYKINEVASKKKLRPFRELSRFLLLGIALGALGFWIVPWIFDYLRTGNWREELNGPAVALTAFWVFINVHHYFIDNVIWRQDNPKVRDFIFSHKE